jgi:hypothetical protein
MLPKGFNSTNYKPAFWTNAEIPNKEEWFGASN